MPGFVRRAAICGTVISALATSAFGTLITEFGPDEYQQTGDTPAGFFGPGPFSIEDFEDNTLDPFLTFDKGAILQPNAFGGFTDSVDGDDTVLDGTGNDGRSWFNGFSSPTDDTMSLFFQRPVSSAGLVFTDGDPISMSIVLEAFDASNVLLATINAGDLADGSVSGETDEDRFLGFRSDMNNIASLTISMDPGIGIEVDHIHWQTTIPEPSALLFVGLIVVGAGIRKKWQAVWR